MNETTLTQKDLLKKEYPFLDDAEIEILSIFPKKPDGKIDTAKLTELQKYQNATIMDKIKRYEKMAEMERKAKEEEAKKKERLLLILEKTKTRLLKVNEQLATEKERELKLQLKIKEKEQEKEMLQKELEQLNNVLGLNKTTVEERKLEREKPIEREDTQEVEQNTNVNTNTWG